MSEPTINKFARGVGKATKAIYYLTLGAIAKPYVDVKDDHHAIVHEFGKFKRTLPPGTHEFNVVTEKIEIVKDAVVPDFNHGVFYRDSRFIEVRPPGKYFVNKALNEALTIKPDTFVGEYQKGILVRNEQYVTTLEPGVHFANPGRDEEIHVQDLHIIKECHRGVKSKEGKFVEVLGPGKWFINSILQEELLVVKEIIVEEHHKGLLMVNGKYVQTLEPGRHFANTLLQEKIIDVNMQILTKELVPQTIFTRDTTSFCIHSVLVYQIVDPVRAICSVEGVDHAIREQIKSISQQVLSEHDLDYVMANKLTLSATIRDRVKDNCIKWGVEVTAIDIKELTLDDSLKHEMTASAKAKRMAESMKIKADAEVENARAMKQVADMLDSKASTHMREMDTLRDICKNPNVKILFVASGVHGLMDERSLGDMVRNQLSASSSSSSP